MRKQLLLAIAFALGIWAYVLMAAANKANPAPQAPSMGAEEGITALFSPSGGCTDALVGEIYKAAQSLDVMAYSFTSQPIADAVIDAASRGVKVRVILDKLQKTDKNSVATQLSGKHVAVYIDDQHALAHNKVMLIDGKIVVTGSFNFTRSSEERNAENLIILSARPKLCATYEANFEQHLSHSIPLSEANTAAAPPAAAPAQ